MNIFFSSFRLKVGSGSVFFPQTGSVCFVLPDPDPTCHNGFIKLFSSWTKYKQESTNSSIKWWFKISNFMPTYLKHKYFFFFISISSRIRSRIRNIYPSKPDLYPDPWKKMSDPHPCLEVNWKNSRYSMQSLGRK